MTPRKIQLAEAAAADHHREHPDPTPVHVPGLGRPPTLEERVRYEIARALGRASVPVHPDEDYSDWTDPSDGEEELSDYQVTMMAEEFILENRRREVGGGVQAAPGGEEPPGSEERTGSEGGGATQPVST